MIGDNTLIIFIISLNKTDNTSLFNDVDSQDTFMRQGTLNDLYCMYDEIRMVNIYTIQNGDTYLEFTAYLDELNLI